MRATDAGRPILDFLPKCKTCERGEAVLVQGTVERTRGLMMSEYVEHLVVTRLECSFCRMRTQDFEGGTGFVAAVNAWEGEIGAASRRKVVGEVVDLQLESILEGLVKFNVKHIDGGGPLFSKNLIRYEPKSDEEVCDLTRVLARGHADVDELAAWRVASLRQTGEDPGARCLVVRHGGKQWNRENLYWTVRVLRSDGTLEDPTEGFDVSGGKP